MVLSFDLAVGADAAYVAGWGVQPNTLGPSGFVEQISLAGVETNTELLSDPDTFAIAVGLALDRGQVLVAGLVDGSLGGEPSLGSRDAFLARLRIP
jgi:hypothetical protein